MRASALEICTYDLTGDARRGSAAETALLHEDGEDDLASAALTRTPATSAAVPVPEATTPAMSPSMMPARSGVVAVRHTFGLDVSSAIPLVVRTASTR